MSGLTDAERSRLLCAWHGQSGEPWPIAMFEVLALGKDTDLDRIQSTLYLFGRNGALPAIDLLANVWDDQTLRQILPHFWSGSEFPSFGLGRRRSVQLWRRVGFTVGGVPSPRPATRGRVTLFRAAPDTQRWGISWTSDRSIAEKFLTAGGRGTLEPRLWTADFPWSRVMSIVHDRDEEEYLVDTLGSGQWRRTLREVEGP